jgi:5-hydroxyisourate hydrolase-like protein (transthyretin family)
MKTTRLAGAIAALGAAAATLAVGSPAHAADLTSPSLLAVSNGVTYESCVDVPYSLAPLSAWASAQAHEFGNIYGYYNYDVNVVIIAPDGSTGSEWEFDREADDVEQSGADTDTYFSCEGPGVYKVQASGYWCPVDHVPSDGDCKTIAISKTFTMRAARSALALSAPKKAKAKKPVIFTATAKVERTTGFYAADDVTVTLQYKKGSRWASLGSDYTDSSGHVKIKAKFARPGNYQVRAVVKVDGDFYSSSTATRSIKIR